MYPRRARNLPRGQARADGRTGAPPCRGTRPRTHIPLIVPPTGGRVFDTPLSLTAQSNGGQKVASTSVAEADLRRSLSHREFSALVSLPACVIALSGRGGARPGCGGGPPACVGVVVSWRVGLDSTEGTQATACARGSAAAPPRGRPRRWRALRTVPKLFTSHSTVGCSSTPLDQ